MATFYRSFRSEWLKQKGTAAGWLIWGGAFILPLLFLAVRLMNPTQTAMGNASEGMWDKLFKDCWQFMAIFLLPMGITLVLSLMAQTEFRNNAWKQVHTSPQALAHIFWAKLLTLLIRLVQFFVLFIAGLFISGWLPALLIPAIPFPVQPFPWVDFSERCFWGFVDCLPIVACQWFLSLHIRNFAIPLGAGIALLMASLLAMPWKYGYILPYGFAGLQVLKGDNGTDPTINLHAVAVYYFVGVTWLNFLLYHLRNQRIRPVSRLWRDVPFRWSMLLFLLLAAGAFFGFRPRKQLPLVALATSPEARMKQVTDRVGWVRFLLKDQPLNLETRMNKLGVHGVSIAVVHNYKLDWAAGFGMADVEAKKPVTKETLFIPGSISKPVHTLAILQLADQKKLDLFTDVNQYLQSWKFPYDAAAKGKKITLAQLLSHSAGVSVHGFGFTRFKPGDALPTIPQVLDGKAPAANPPVRSLFEPGLQYQYSGGGTLISQMLLMDHTRQAYAPYMKAHVLGYLGMTHSFYDQPLPETKRADVATGYTQMNGGKALEGKVPVMPQQAAAGLWTTASDLARFVIQVQMGLKGDGTSLISKQVAEWMTTSYTKANTTLGLFIEERTGQNYFYHSAGNPGFMGKMMGSLEGGNGVVVLANSDAHPELLDEVIQAVGEVYQWPGFERFVPMETKTPKIISPELLTNYAGVYRVDNSIALVEKKEGAALLWVRGSATDMHFDTDSTFFDVEGQRISIFYHRRGKIAGIRMVSPDGTTKHVKRVDTVAITNALAVQYAGAYREPDGETATLQWYNRRLWLHSPNALKPLPLHFLNSTEFYLDDSHAVLAFVKTEGGKIKGITPPGADKILIERQNP